jgi:hypothetical protein
MRAILCLALVLPLHADLTLRYKTSYQLIGNLPAELTEQMKKQMAASLPPEAVIRIHGDLFCSAFGQLTMIVDSNKQQITLLHPASKRYAVAAPADFSNAMLAGQSALPGIDIDVKAARSGKSGVVLQVPAEETIVTMTVNTPVPNGSPVELRMEQHHWFATAAALERFPELKQWDAKKLAAIPGLIPTERLAAGGAQGASTEKLRDAMQALAKESTGLSLKTETNVFMPSIVRMLAQGATATDAPLVTTVMELESYSADSIPDAMFHVPADYTAAPLADLLQEFNPAKPRVP